MGSHKGSCGGEDHDLSATSSFMDSQMGGNSSVTSSFKGNNKNIDHTSTFLSSENNKQLPNNDINQLLSMLTSESDHQETNHTGNNFDTITSETSTEVLEDRSK